jgi:hypothetical protein
MESITQYVEQRLKLRVNRQKSAVAPAADRPLLGFEFFRDKAGKVRVTVAPKALKRPQDRIGQLTRRQLERLDGAADQGDQPLYGRMDGVLRVRRHLPTVRQARQVAAPQAQAGALEGVETRTNRYRNLRALGIPTRDARSWAASQKGYWRIAGSWPLQRALPNAYWHETLGLKGFLDPYRGFREC